MGRVALFSIRSSSPYRQIQWFAVLAELPKVVAFFLDDVRTRTALGHVHLDALDLLDTVAPSTRTFSGRSLPQRLSNQSASPRRPSLPAPHKAAIASNIRPQKCGVRRTFNSRLQIRPADKIRNTRRIRRLQSNPASWDLQFGTPGADGVIRRPMVRTFCCGLHREFPDSYAQRLPLAPTERVRSDDRSESC